jgi:thioredoxin-related protein
MEKGDGPDVAKQFNVSFYPTFLFFNPDGKLVHKAVGGRPAM